MVLFATLSDEGGSLADRPYQSFGLGGGSGVHSLQLPAQGLDKCRDLVGPAQLKPLNGTQPAAPCVGFFVALHVNNTPGRSDLPSQRKTSHEYTYGTTGCGSALLSRCCWRKIRFKIEISRPMLLLCPVWIWKRDCGCCSFVVDPWFDLRLECAAVFDFKTEFCPNFFPSIQPPIAAPDSAPCLDRVHRVGHMCTASSSRSLTDQ